MRTRSLLALLLIAAFAACGGDTTDPDDDDDDDDPVEDHTEEMSAPTLSAANIVGATVTSSATGSATFVYDTTTEVLSFTLNVANMDHVIGAHIHAPATAAQNADIPLVLFAPDAPTGTVNGQLVSGTVTASSPLIVSSNLSQILEWMRTGMAFVMVHSSEYPDGEIRGQVQLDDSPGVE